MDSIMQAFIGTTLGIWMALGALCFIILILIFAEFEYYKSMVFATILVLVGGWFTEIGTNIFTLMYTNPWTTICGIICYFIIGSAYSVYRWWDRIKKFKSKYDKMVIQFEENKKSNYFDEDYTWEMHARHNIKPVIDIKNNKSLLSSWIVYWPPMIIWSIINDPFRKITKLIIKYLGNTYNKITVSILGDDINNIMK